MDLRASCRRCLALLALPGLMAAAPLFTPAFGKLKFNQPLSLVQDPADPATFYISEQAGRIWRVRNNKKLLYADLRKQVRTDSPEEGLLCVAWHPKAYGRWYAIYSLEGARPRVTRLVERRGQGKAEKVLLEVSKRWGNHNGSTLAFGPDGFLYISLGDGGGAGDSLDSAQNLKSLLGKVLRIDVDHADVGLAYAIPADNPFVGRPDARPEIWAYGLRNAWRMSFDSATGKLWAGDVGQDEREEIDIIAKGGNYGWNWREGKQAYKSGQAPAGLIEPVLDYGRKEGFSVTGGVVGRGTAPAWAQGRYLFADFGSQTLWSLDASQPAPASLRVEGPCPEPPASFATDSAGHIYVLGYAGGIYQLH